MGVFGQFIEKIGPSENPYTLPSRKRFLKLLRARDSEAAVAEMSKHLRRLHNQYLARWTEMHRRIGQLPGAERETFNLLWYLDLTQEEAAQVLGVSRRTVIKRWQKARLLLHEVVNDVV